jgi:hypothetical protein
VKGVDRMEIKIYLDGIYMDSCYTDYKDEAKGIKETILQNGLSGLGEVIKRNWFNLIKEGKTRNNHPKLTVRIYKTV